MREEYVIWLVCNQIILVIGIEAMGDTKGDEKGECNKRKMKGRENEK